jgi:outer membrane receptor for Fe3+-dicitrate
MNHVGMAIQAVDGATLENLRVTDMRDLTTVAPSFTVSQSYQGVPTYTLRGIGFNTINLSSTSTVGTYVDEVAYAYPLMNIGPVMDLERVEVLKGPQGTLYGRNTTAGLINFITAKPTDSFEGNIKADLGNYQTYNIGGHISGLQRLKPAPRTARPGVAPLCSPFRNTPTPLTKTSRIPTEYWCGFSKVDRSPIVAGSNTTTSA